jgi:hypothetical protein
MRSRNDAGFIVYPVVMVQACRLEGCLDFESLESSSSTLDVEHLLEKHVNGPDLQYHGNAGRGGGTIYKHCDSLITQVFQSLSQTRS